MTSYTQAITKPMPKGMRRKFNAWFDWHYKTFQHNVTKKAMAEHAWKAATRTR